MAKRISQYKAVILAAGKGTRMYPITLEIPKPLLPVRKKPIVNYLVDLFLENGIKDVAVVVNKEFEEDFLSWRKRYYPKNNIFIASENEPSGTLGGVRLVRGWIGNNPFFVSNGDELKEVDVRALATSHEQGGGLGTISLVKVGDPHNYGVVVLKKGRVDKFLEKPKNPPSPYVNSGLYVFSPKVFDYAFNEKFAMIENDLLPQLVKEKQLVGFQFKGRWMDCGTLPRYENAIKTWHLDG